MIKIRKTAFNLAVLLVTGVAANAADESRVVVKLHAEIQNPSDQSARHFCIFTADVENHTQNHLNGATIHLAGRSFDIPGLAANNSISNIEAWDVSIPDQASSCEQKAKWFDQIAATAHATTCKMDGVREGDCQRLVTVKGAFNYIRLRQDDRVATATSTASLRRHQEEADAEARTEIAEAKSKNLALGKYWLHMNQGCPKCEVAFPLCKTMDETTCSKIVQNYAGPAVEVTEVHTDKSGVADWYKVKQVYGDAVGWISRSQIASYSPSLISAPSP